MLYTPPTGSTDPNAPYIGKNVPGGTQGSKVPPGAAENPQREIQNVIVEGGYSPTNADLKQLLKAIRSGNLSTYDDVSTVPNVIVINPPTAHTALFRGLPFRIFPKFSNTTAAVAVFINGISCQLLRRDGTQFAAGDIFAGVPIDVVHDGTRLLHVGIVPSGIQGLIALAIANIQANALPNIVACTGLVNVYTKTVFNNSYAIMEGAAAVTVSGGYVDFYLPVAFTTDNKFTCLVQDTNSGTTTGGSGIFLSGVPLTGGMVRLYPRAADGSAYTGALSFKYICVGHQ